MSAKRKPFPYAVVKLGSSDHGYNVFPLEVVGPFPSEGDARHYIADLDGEEQFDWDVAPIAAPTPENPA